MTGAWEELERPGQEYERGLVVSDGEDGKLRQLVLFWLHSLGRSRHVAVHRRHCWRA